MRKSVLTLAVAGLALLLLAACRPVTLTGATGPDLAPDLAAGDDGEGALAGAQATTVAALGALGYTGISQTGPITLTDGDFVFTDAASGDSFQVRLLGELAVVGDLDGDEFTDAVATLELDTRGSGRFTYLAPVLDVWNTPWPGPAVALGDRVQVNAIAVADGRVVVDYLGHGERDGDCCPTAIRRNTYAWQEGALIEVSNE